MTKNGDLVGSSSDGKAGIMVMKEAVACKCGVMACFLVNRDGSTRCVSCDSQYQEEKLALLGQIC